MKVVIIIARVLLGLIFVIFGLNGFLGFLHAPMASGAAGAFMGAMLKSHYFYLVSGVQIIAGLLLLIGQFVPLALALLAPILANILTYHVTMDPVGAQFALLAVFLWLILAWNFRAYFRSLLVRKAVMDQQAGSR